MEWDHPDWEYFEIQRLRGKSFAGEWPTIPEYLQHTIERFPQNPAFTSFSNNGKETICYAELAIYIEALARSLQNIGLKPGDRVVISGKNSAAWGITYLAVLCAGMVAVPIDSRQELRFQQNLITFTDAKALFMDKDLLQRIGKHPCQSYLLSPANSADEETIWSLIEEQKPNVSGDLCSLATLQMNDLAALLATSGTTGNEKLAMLSHGNFSSNIIQCVYPGLQEILSTDRLYLLLPMHHSYPMTAVFLESIAHGSEVVFPRGLAVQQIIQDLKDGKITVFMGIPLLFNKIIQGVLNKVQEQNPLKRLAFYAMLKISSISDRIKRPIGSKLFAGVLKTMGFDHIRILICGAGALMPEVGEKYRQLGLDFIQGYGLTEAAPIVALNPAGTPEVRSVGKLLPMIAGRLEFPAEELPCPSAQISKKVAKVQNYEIGELCIDGPNKMQGYYKNPEATASIFTPDGFLRTGDMGYFDQKGYFHITGRSKNVIVTSGGKNIYPEEIEELFQLCSDIEQVMIRGYHEQDSEKVELLIYPKLSEKDVEKIAANREFYLAGDREKFAEFLAPKEQQELLEHVKQVNQNLLAYQKISRVRIVFLPLDTTTTQKIKRFLVEGRLKKYNDGILIPATQF